MVQANVPLVEHIVNRVAVNLPASHSRDDLVQTGILGLISATVRFDPAMGTAFSTFAGKRIEGAIIDMLRQADWAPRSVRAMERKLNGAEERLGASQKSTVAAISHELGCNTTQLEQLRHDIAKARLDSLDRPTRAEDGPMPVSATVMDPGANAEEQLDHQELMGYLRDGVSLLPERHRIVTIGFFFEGRTITELGNLLGVTQSRASQIKDESIKMLRQGLREVYAESGEPPSQAVAPARTGKQQMFVESVANSRPWRDRLAAGKGVSVTG